MYKCGGGRYRKRGSLGSKPLVPSILHCGQRKSGNMKATIAIGACLAASALATDPITPDKVEADIKTNE